MQSSISRMVGIFAGAVMVVGASLAIAGGIVTRLEAGLTSSSSLKGKAAYVTESLAGGAVRQKLAVEMQGGAPNAVLPLAVNGGTIGAITTDGLGRAKFEIRVGGDDPGSGVNTIPEIGVGDTFSAGGASGKFARK